MTALLVAVGVLAAAVGGYAGTRLARRNVGARADEEARRLVEIVGGAMTMPADVPAADRIVGLLGEALGADAAAVGLVRGNVLRIFGMWNYGPDMRASRLRPGEGLSGRAWAEGRPLVVGDVGHTAAYVEGAAGVRSGAYVPGRVNGQVVAVVCVESRRAHAYSNRDLPLLQAVADLVAAMVLSRRQRREAAALEDRPVPLIGREIRPALDRARLDLAAATGSTGPQRTAALAVAIRSARRVEQLLESLFAATRIASEIEVHARDLSLQRVVQTAVQAAGAAAAVDVTVPALLRITADEALLVQALRELLADANGPAARRPTVTAGMVAEEVGLHLDVPDPGPLRRHVARQLVEAMHGRLEPSWPSGITVLLPPGRFDQTGLVAERLQA